MLRSVILVFSCTLFIAASNEMGTCGEDDEVCKSDQASLMQFKEVLVDAHPHNPALVPRAHPVKSSHSVADVLKSGHSADFLNFQDENSEHMVSKTGHVQLRATEEDFNAVLLYLAQDNLNGTTEAPTTKAPATEAPTTKAPATKAPATEAPATEAPTTESPPTEEPATEAPAEGNKTQDNKTQKDKEFHFKKFCEAKWMSAAQQKFCIKMRPLYVGLKKIQLKNGLVTSGDGYNEDGNIFSDGQGITVGLYTKFVKGNTTVCETGFGGGYGALFSLASCEHCNLYIFDDEANPYAKASADYLRAKFPGRLNMIWGDSQKTLPRFQKDKPGVKCDFVMIDGGRSYKVAQADTLNFAKMVSSPQAPVLQHDCPIKGFPDFLNSVCRAWHELAAQKCVKNEHDLSGVSWGTLDAQKCKNFVPPKSGAHSIHMAGIVAFAVAVFTGAGILV